MYTKQMSPDEQDDDECRESETKMEGQAVTNLKEQKDSPTKLPDPDEIEVVKDGEDEERQVITCTEFDDILEIIGSVGKFQKRVLYGYLLPYVSIIPLLVINTVFILYEPNHWCHVPGKGVNISIEEWKTLTIPREIGTNQYSQCYMYKISGNETTRNESDLIECQYGWDYDHSDYSRTIPSSFDWVCSRSHYATAAFTANYAGNFLGAIVLGWAGDKIGRRYVFFIANFLSLAFRFVSFLIPQYFYLFVLLQFIGGLGYPMMYLAPMTILSEISGKEYRSWIYASVWVTWVFGLSTLPFVAYLTGDYLQIAFITSAPGLLIFVFYKCLPESPRWLVSVGRLREASRMIARIARVNRTSKYLKRDDLQKMFHDVHFKQSKSEIPKPQAWDLFRDKIVAKNTIILSSVWAINSLIYYGVILNTTSMGGNQFINFFVLSIIEFPVGLVTRPVVENAGRRWPQVIGLLFCAAGFFLAAFGVTYDGQDVLILVSVVVSKTAVSLTSLIAHLQTNEIFPTQLRSTAFGFTGMVAAFACIAAPMMVYLSKIHPSGPYLAMGIISSIGVILSAFLPETLNQSLPETFEDVNEMEAHTKFWSFLPKDYKRK